MFELYLDDCFNVMPKIKDKSIDLILCDLPYGTTDIKWDSALPFEELWKEYKRLIKDNGAIVLFGTEPFSSKLRLSNIEWYRYDWVWEKNKAPNFAQAPYMPLKNTENIIVFSKGTIAQNSRNRMVYFPQGIVECNKIVKGSKANDFRPNRKDQEPFLQKNTNYPKQILTFPKEGKSMHPTQKPVELLKYLINTYTLENEVVLDNCMGSGSTGVACKELNRSFIGIEKAEKYFNIAKERIENAKTGNE